MTTFYASSDFCVLVAVVCFCLVWQKKKNVKSDVFSPTKSNDFEINEEKQINQHPTICLI